MSKFDFSEVFTIDDNAPFSVEEAARLLKRSQSGVRKWIHSGLIKTGRVGRQYFLTGSEIKRMITLPETTVDSL